MSGPLLHPCLSFWLERWFGGQSKARRRAGYRFTLFRLEQLEDRVTPTGTVTLTNVSVVDGNDRPLTVVNVGERVYMQADFTTQNLPSDASYRIAYTVNGLTLETGDLTWGAGTSGTQS